MLAVIIWGKGRGDNKVFDINKKAEVQPRKDICVEIYLT